MQKLLIPIDGSPGSERAVQHVVKLACMACALAIPPLHVQPPLGGCEVHHVFCGPVIVSMQHRLALEAP